MRKVKITKVGGEKHDVTFNSNYNSSALSNPDVEANKTLKPVDKDEANAEIEKGEVVISNFMGDGIPESYVAGGKRHAKGGTPVTLPENSFIFSDTKKLKIKDEEVLKEFGMSKPSTPAVIAKQFDYNKYKTILMDPKSDKREIETAEKMIENLNQKVGKLALLQESMKGFKDGAPMISQPYMMANGLDPAMFVPQIEQAPMGAPSFKNGGEKKRRVKIVKYENGGEPKVKKEGDSSIKEGDIVELKDGTLKRYEGFKEVRGAYEDLEAQFTNMSPEAKQQFIENSINEIRNSDARVFEKNPELREKILKRYEENPDGIISDFLQGQKQIYTASEHPTLGKQLRSGERHDSLDTGPDVGANLGYKDIAKELDMEALSPEQIAGFQAGFRSLNSLAGTPGFETIKPTPFGNPDEVDPEGNLANISKVDTIWGDTTFGQQALSERKENIYGDYTPEPTPEPIADVPQAEIEIPAQAPADAPYWKQDVLGAMNAFGNYASLKKYMPWSAPADLQQADPTFVDPSRAIAGVTEATSAASQGLNPQDVASRLRLQGASAGQIANIMGQYDNQNVSIANQFAQMNNQTANQEAMMEAKRKTSDFDKTTIANQQYDNAKREAKAEITKQYQNAITNRWKTDAMNQLFPNFTVDPYVGGQGHYAGKTKDFTPVTPQDQEAQLYKVADLARRTGLDTKDVLSYMQSGSMPSGGEDDFQRRKLQQLMAHYTGGQ